MTNTNQSAEFFVSQWGYEQTNVTFYKVLKRTAKTVTLIKVNSRREYLDWANYIAVPVDAIAEGAKAFRRKILDWGKGREAVSINSYSSAFTWDGTAVEGSSSY